MRMKRTASAPTIPLTPALTFALMTGTQATVRLVGWVTLAQERDVETALEAAWTQHGAALTAEAAAAGFEPHWLHRRRPTGPGFQAWSEAFLAASKY